MQKVLRLIARLIVARHECTYVRHFKENAPIYMCYVALETPMMSSVIDDCPDIAPPQYFGQVYAYVTIDGGDGEQRKSEDTREEEEKKRRSMRSREE